MKIFTLIRNRFQNLHLELSKFLVSNLIYSFSTILGTLSFGYLLSINDYSNYTLMYQYIMYFYLLLEFGLTTSIIRNYSINPIETLKAQKLVEFVLFLLVIIMVLFFIGAYFYGKEFLLSNGYLFLYIIGAYGQLCFVFNKSINLVKKEMKLIFWSSIFVFITRFMFVIIVYLYKIHNVNYLIIGFFIIPFSFEIINTLKGFIEIKIKNFIVEKKTIKKYLLFSSSIFASSLLYNFNLRVIYIGLEYYDNRQIIASLGFSSAFIGILSVFNATVKSYFMSKLNLYDELSIKNYLDKIQHYFVKYVLFSLLIIILLNIINYVISPKGLTIDFYIILTVTLIYTFGTLYLGLYTMLSKTYNLLKAEILINIVRLFLIIITVLLLVKLHPVMTYVFVISIILLLELFFYKFIIKRRILRNFGNLIYHQ